MEKYNVKEIRNSLSNKKGQFILKRIFDIIFSILLLIILSPLFLFIMIWIEIDSRGGCIFKQKRIGIDGEEFTIYKFRTMIKDADKMFKANVKKEELKTFKFQDKNDSRITSAGRFLRKTSLDELPQLINIIKGDMSLIGPRPEIPEIVELYSSDDRIRLLVKPGVTGLAQVNGRGDLELSETIKYDINYISNFSLWLDLKIFFKTFATVFKREGAY